MVEAQTDQNHKNTAPFLNKRIVDSYIPGSRKASKGVFNGVDTEMSFIIIILSLI